MATRPNQKTGHRRSRGREAKRLLRDREIVRKLRLLVTEAERRHAQFGEAIEPLSVFYGKEDKPASWDLTPFPLGKQGNGKPMPQWEDLSQWMKVTMATIVCNEWDLLTFNINLHPGLELELVAKGKVRPHLSERVRKHLSRSIGVGREYFFVIEGHSKNSGTPTHLHMHGAIATYDAAERRKIENALAKSAGHDVRGNSRIPRAVHLDWFKVMQIAYPNYLFKFTLRDDPRLDSRRLVMSRSMTQAAKMFWNDIARPDLS
ncbi:hypothetical protein [uncultured Parasphingorhabdus sp.]|uniref:hypothetical protein n=1 Tax=uncultured Parasphingorhabdus sp. TaxID=2709694 RepID=UPI003749EA82